jgi:hypothetical protein
MGEILEWKIAAHGLTGSDAEGCSVGLTVASLLSDILSCLIESCCVRLRRNQRPQLDCLEVSCSELMEARASEGVESGEE